MRLIVRADARRELNAACDYLDNARPGYGALFAKQMVAEFEMLLQFPKIGKLLFGEVRRRMVPGWSHSIIYTISGEKLIIIAIPHYRRDETYWHSRIR